MLDVVAVDNETYIEWMDGLRVLFSEEGDFDDLGTAVEDAAGLAVPGGISGLKYAQVSPRSDVNIVGELKRLSEVDSGRFDSGSKNHG